MRLLFGDQAHQIASQEANPTHRRQWLQKCLKELLRKINKLDTTPRHKQALMAEIESASKILKGAVEPSWEFTYRLLRLSMRLLGYSYGRGAHCYTPNYHQSADQYYTCVILDGGDVMQDYHDKQDAISLRRQVVAQLKSQGLNDFKISLVLNTSEYQIKVLRSEFAPDL
ncbi:MAG: hypothetical protein ACREPT_08120 [Rudaea sp.]